MKATIHEMGNGLPTAGDYVASPDSLYLVESIDSRIQTGGAGSGVANYVYASVEPVEWDECPEGDEFPARVTLEADDDDDAPGADCELDADETAFGFAFREWLAAAGRTDSASEYDLRAAWRAGEDPAEYLRGQS